MQRKHKPAIIMLQGRSIKDMDILKYKDAPVVWASLNNFLALEKNILSKINKKFDIIYCSSDERFQDIKDHLKGRQLLTTTRVQFYAEEPLWDDIWTNDDAYGFCSLWGMLCALINLGFREMFIFGADGYDTNGKTYYGMPKEKKGVGSIVEDYRIMSKYFWELTNYWGLDLRDVKIINMNPKSKLTCFTKGEGAWMIMDTLMGAVSGLQSGL